MFAFAVIIIKQLLTKQFSMNKRKAKAPCNVVLENIIEYAY